MGDTRRSVVAVAGDLRPGPWSSSNQARAGASLDGVEWRQVPLERKAAG